MDDDLYDSYAIRSHASFKPELIIMGDFPEDEPDRIPAPFEMNMIGMGYCALLLLPFLIVGLGVAVVVEVMR